MHDQKKKFSPTLIFAVIARREVEFFLEVAESLKADFDIRFISFFEPGVDKIRQRGFPVFNCFANEFVETELPFTDKQWSSRQKEHSCYSIHERLTFGLEHDADLNPKYETFIRMFHGFLGKLHDEKSNIVVFQELGGFVAPMALYFSCRDLNIRHVFFEPSFFLKRIHFNTDTLNFNSWPTTTVTAEISQNVDAYLEHYKSSHARIAPVKDTQHYRKFGIRKIFNLANFRKLATKIRDKYFFKLKEEYSHIGNHVFRAICAQVTFFRLQQFYKKMIYINETDKRYVFFPLHVSLDYQLTTRSPKFVNQLDVVEKILAQLQPGYKLLLKEHPITVGTLPFAQLKKLLSRSDVTLLDPQESVHNILPICESVVTINSKVGAEALIYGKTVYCLGESFYRNFAGVVALDDTDQLRDALENKTAGSPNSMATRKDFEKLWQVTYPGELYDMTPSNIGLFTASIRDYLNCSTRF